MLLKLRKEKVIELLCLNFLQEGSKETLLFSIPI